MGSSRRIGLWAALTAVLVAVLAPAASAAPGGFSSPRKAWAWPLQPDPAVVRTFVAPPQPWAAGHRGVDLTADPGQAVLAPAPGVVTFAGVVVDRGVLTIGHAGGVRTSYEPVSPVVAAGDVVARGQVVAVVTAAPSHCPPVTCLHWGARIGDRYVDPLRWVRTPEPPVLLPILRVAAAG